MTEAEKEQMENILMVSPFYRNQDYYGHLISLDGTSTDDFTIDDVESLIVHGDTGGGWDGTEAAIFLLKDGRYVGYETFWDTTGDGFSCDAYGGDADLYFGATLDIVARMGLDDWGRKLCGIDEDGNPLAK